MGFLSLIFLTNWLLSWAEKQLCPIKFPHRKCVSFPPPTRPELLQVRSSSQTILYFQFASNLEQYLGKINMPCMHLWLTDWHVLPPPPYMKYTLSGLCLPTFPSFLGKGTRYRSSSSFSVAWQARQLAKLITLLLGSKSHGVTVSLAQSELAAAAVDGACSSLQLVISKSCTNSDLSCTYILPVSSSRRVLLLPEPLDFYLCSAGGAVKF